MNKKISFPIAIIIIVICALLVGLVAWKYGIIPGEKITSPAPSGMPQDTIFGDDCDKLREQIYNLLEKENYCNKDSECKALHREPFTYSDCVSGCYNLLNKNAELTKINESIEKYSNNNCQQWVCECGAPPLQKDIKCKNNKCIVVQAQTPQMTESQVLSIANDLAKKEGYNLEQYLEPEVDYNFSEKEWLLFYHMKPPEPPGGCFIVSINDDTGEAILLACE